MKVKALKSFVGRDQRGNKYRVQEGEIITLPEGVDWLSTGLVEAVEGETPKPAKRVKKGK